MIHKLHAVAFALLISTNSFAGGVQGGGGPPARTVDETFEKLESGDLLSRPEESVLEIPISEIEIEEIISKGFGNNPRTITTLDGAIIPLKPSGFKFKDRTVDVKLDGSATLRFRGVTTPLLTAPFDLQKSVTQ